jgi:replication factor A1
MEGNYEKIVNKLSRVSGLEGEEINRRVEAKRAKLSGLISREGALQIIAAELGISFDNEKLKINELLPGMRKVNFVGKIINIYPIRVFKTKNGDEGKVANMIVADDTGNIKVVLWDTNHISLIERGDVNEGTCIEVFSGSMRDNEVHLGSFSEFKLSKEILEDVKTEKSLKEKKIAEFNLGDKVKLRAFVVHSFDPRFFEANLETGKKATEEELASGIPTEKRAIWNIVVDDGTESIRTVLFHENVQAIGLNEYNDLDLMNQQKENIFGKEFVLVGNVKMNSYFHTPELVVESVEELDLDNLIAELEK